MIICTRESPHSGTGSELILLEGAEHDGLLTLLLALRHHRRPGAVSAVAPVRMAGWRLSFGRDEVSLLGEGQVHFDGEVG